MDWQCLNVDELVTQYAARYPADWIIGWSLYRDYNPPLYYLSAHFSLQLFGDTTAALRIPAVLYGTATIPVMYLIGKKLRGQTLGLLFASVSTFMYPFFYYSQDARAYSLVMLGFMGFTYFFIGLYRREWSKWNCLGLSLCAALCFYSHFYSLVPIALMLLILLWRDWPSTLRSIVYLVLLCIPEALLFNPNQFATRTVPEIYNVYWATPWQMASWLPNELLCWAVIIVVPMVLTTLWFCKESLLKIFTIVGLITAASLIPLTKLTGLSPRYALLISPLFLLVALYLPADKIDAEPDMMRRIGIFLAIVFVFVAFNYGSYLSWYTFNYCPYMFPGLYE